jgi:hypothetical protein
MTSLRAPLFGLLLLALGCDEGLTIARGDSRLEVDPEAVDFGKVAIGAERTTDLVLKNEGSVSLKVSGAVDLALGAEFRLEEVPAVLQPNQEVVVLLHFAPTSPGLRQGKLVFTTDSDTTPVVEIPVQGQGVEPALVANPPLVDFGRVVIGRSETATVTLTNRSDEDVEVIRADRDASTSAEFNPAVTRMTLAPGASVDLVLTYQPTDLGLDEGRVTVLDSGPRIEALNVRVRGEGVDSDILVEPVALTFRGLYVGQTQSQFFQLRNIGDKTHRITELNFVSTGADRAGEFSLAAATPARPFELAPGAMQSVEVVYLPTDANADLDQVRVDSTGLRAPVLVAIDAAADPAPIPVIDVQPVSLDFGPVELAQSRSLGLGIRNIGTADLTLTGTITIQPAGTPYSLVAPPASGSVLRPTDLSMFQVAFSPTVVGAAPSAEVVITSNDPARPEVRVPLMGLGETTAVPVIFVSPNPLDFGSVPRAVRASRPILVRNDGTAPLVLNLVRLTNDAGGRFLLPAPPAPATTLAPTQSMNFAVDYLDNGVVATYNGMLEIQSNAPSGPVLVPLTAATEPPPPVLTDIAITMRWTTPDTDVDLHLIRPGGTFFDTPTDCCFCNPNPDWGVVGQANDNAFLDRDDIVGPGPENINLSVAETGQYQVVLHYYSDHGNGPTSATVEVRLRGNLIATETTMINGSERWIAGRINWNSVTQTGTWTGPSAAPFFTIFASCN